MARNLKLGVVAEGVETAGQARRLAAAGCNVQQGWLFARALDAASFEALCRKTDAGRSWRLAAPALARVQR
jgi:sensor c-di-GMP phosphodiesterase-like protein